MLRTFSPVSGINYQCGIFWITEKDEADFVIGKYCIVVQRSDISFCNLAACCTDLVLQNFMLKDKLVFCFHSWMSERTSCFWALKNTPVLQFICSGSKTNSRAPEVLIYILIIFLLKHHISWKQRDVWSVKYWLKEEIKEVQLDWWVSIRGLVFLSFSLLWFTNTFSSWHRWLTETFLHHTTPNITGDTLCSSNRL